MIHIPPWRPLLGAVVACAALAGPAALHAGDAPAAPPPDPQAVADFGAAMASGDSTLKREGLRAIATLGKEFDDAAYRCLVQAAGDRQTHDDAVLALRGRSGLSPGILNSGPGYPGYPVSDSGADWGAWLAARTKEKAEKKQIADQAAKLKELEKKKEEKEKGGDKTDDKTAAKPGDAAPATEGKKTTATEQAPSDLGKPSRIIFKNGGSLVCYVIFKRTDPDGVLQSVRIVHLDGGGEETLTADLIARIEESAR
jgi:hypothetical protein